MGIDLPNKAAQRKINREWTRMYTNKNSQMDADQLKKIKYPQITQITQISSGASDTAKDRTSHQRTLAPVHARTSTNWQ